MGHLENREHARAKIAEAPWPRHALLLPLAALLTMVLYAPARAKDPTAPLLTERDVDEVISRYRAPAAPEQVAAWSSWSRSTFRPPLPEFRKAVVGLFPEAWRARRNSDPAAARELQALLRPVLSVYGVDYELFVIETPKPSLFLDSDAVMVLTTGLISRARSDDELSGLIAHEVAHARFAQRTAAAKALLAGLTAEGKGQSDGAWQALRELSRIELECDAVAARTLLTLGQDPGEFVRGIRRIEQDFPDEVARGGEYGVDWHPPAEVRLRVVTALDAPGGTRNGPTRSARLKTLQDLLGGPPDPPAILTAPNGQGGRLSGGA
ncbi:MAG: M48 family metalloprotease [Acidobacteria bacterium]|nr:M48 family metalloprotease [Acidobacteriota bacterium]